MRRWDLRHIAFACLIGAIATSKIVIGLILLASAALLFVVSEFGPWGRK